MRKWGISDVRRWVVSAKVDVLFAAWCAAVGFFGIWAFCGQRVGLNYVEEKGFAERKVPISGAFSSGKPQSSTVWEAHVSVMWGVWLVLQGGSAF